MKIIIFEEISKAKSEDAVLRILSLTNEIFNSILLSILENNLAPNGGELLNLKIN